MPSTARISISSSSSIGVAELDDVIVSQHGRHDSLGNLTSQTVNWPTTAETRVYIHLPMGEAVSIVNIKADETDPIGWEFTIPIGDEFVPILLPKPASGKFILTATVAIPVVHLFYF